MKIIISFLLFSTLMLAQQHKSAFQKAIDSVNAILYKTKKVRYINLEYDIYNLRKINANKTGNVFLIDTLTSNHKKYHYKIFNLLDVKEFVWKGKEIQIFDNKNQKIGAISNIEIQYIRKFIKQLDVLRLIFLSNANANENPKFKYD